MTIKKVVEGHLQKIQPGHGQRQGRRRGHRRRRRQGRRGGHRRGQRRGRKQDARCHGQDATGNGQEIRCDDMPTYVRIYFVFCFSLFLSLTGARYCTYNIYIYIYIIHINTYMYI